MDKILDLIKNIDKLGEKVPELDSVLDWVLKLTSLAVRVGPYCILVLGLIYLLIPPKEANRKAGYRTFFGMGSIGAWRFTQFVAGVVMTLCGLFLTMAANRAEKGFADMDPNQMLDTAFGLIKSQVICAVVIFVFMMLISMVMFTVKGELRFKFLRGTLLEKLLFDEKPLRILMRAFGIKGKHRQKKPMFIEPQEAEAPEVLPEPEPEPETASEPEPQYERQGEQKITAEDIVIEDL